MTERRLLARLSVFAGGCTRDSVGHAVCAGIPIELVAIVRTAWRAGGPVAGRRGARWCGTRYRLLETIREYGEERLAEHGETEVLRRRHAEHYLDLARRLFEEAAGPGEVDAARRLRAEEDNLLAAMTNAIDTRDTRRGAGPSRQPYGI